MTYFKGKNEIKSIRRLISERIKYQTQSYIREDEDEAPPQVVDFNFAERTLYGRVDRQLNPVIPNENFLFPLVFDTIHVSNKHHRTRLFFLHCDILHQMDRLYKSKRNILVRSQRHFSCIIMMYIDTTQL